MKIVLALLLAGLSSTVLAAHQSFTFSQGGYDEGAVVTGSFIGDDLDSNGQLERFGPCGGEVIDFEMSFSGNSIVGSFSLGCDDLYGLVYDLDGGPLGDGLSLAIEGIGAAGGVFKYEVGPGPVAQCGQQADCGVVTDGDNSDFSQELVQVNATPIPPVPLSPAALIIITLMLGSVGVVSLRNRI